ncbi:30S ribosome-binding factor RbfA [Enterobacteriaceae endosymbiont of Donacia cincticornis]|uniref:30S ribosome-binding factor RbfA n=1 Tax=Enterobacteriaceae endosymbiont of Donacia cincticornis TaxID=2675773 RepID=UPI001448B85C|nr:30S ribosome-binding factor RbfA [Enterobacteriaceae endosymbiont of Donacia cincticornis]QJC36185.1 30S ribosome-binding factor RbfA [Enterobacteriaceae endosymbiont of Donacia cincticornis]
MYRNLRIAYELKKQISKIIQHNLNDIRINKFTTITDLVLSRDFSYAKIFIILSYKEEVKNKKKSLIFLNKITEYIRYILKKKIKLRKIPKLKFILDPSFKEGNYINDLLNRIK